MSDLAANVTKHVFSLDKLGLGSQWASNRVSI